MNSVERKEARYQRRKAARLNRRKAALDTCGGAEAAFSLDALVQASHKCQSGVSWKRNVQGFCLNRVLNCTRLVRRLESGSYKPGKAQRFQIHERGKVRDISSVPFPDRVTQRALCDRVLVHMVARRLIGDNGASLPGKGTSFSRDRLVLHLQRHYRRYGLEGAIVLFDFSKYFASIDADTAVKQLEAALCCKRLSDAVEPFLRSEDAGLGLGNQTSQTAAILYPNAIDHWVYESSKAHAYGRYMDDGYALFASLEDAREFAALFKSKCKYLGLTLNPRKFRVIRVFEPFVFLKIRFQLMDGGHVHKRICAESIKREKRRIRKHAALVANGRMELESAACSYASWRGVLLAGDSDRYLQKKMDTYFYEVFGCTWRNALVVNNDRKKGVRNAMSYL